MRLSVLDIAPVENGSTPAKALAATLSLARRAEELGCERFWVAEHHGSRNIASTSPAVILAAIGAVTSRIRIGAGGVLLLNHPPLVVAEQFETLEALYPGRINLGIGRAPGGDATAAKALRRQPDDRFPDEFDELMDLLDGAETIAVWVLGSSVKGARMAAERGLPFAYAHHFQPTGTAAAISEYRENFKPSDRCLKPYVMVCVNTVCAETNEQARLLADPGQLQFLLDPAQPYPTVAEAIAHDWSPEERHWADQRQALQAIGSPEMVRERLGQITADADELMVVNTIADEAAKLESLVRMRELV
jgi:luciferase family oxidoreductase group 1